MQKSLPQLFLQLLHEVHMSQPDLKYFCVLVSSFRPLLFPSGPWVYPAWVTLNTSDICQEIPVTQKIFHLFKISFKKTLNNL